MMRLPVRSRRWNLFLAILGSIYAVSATFLLAWYVRDVWNSEGIIDRVFEIALLLSILCGICFAISALANLGLRERPWHLHRVTSRSTARP
ncbi:MAG: hypothetical protein ACJ74H_14335 [Thermoanaerobaculia bacterium]